MPSWEVTLLFPSPPALCPGGRGLLHISLTLSHPICCMSLFVSNLFFNVLPDNDVKNPEENPNHSLLHFWQTWPGNAVCAAIAANWELLTETKCNCLSENGGRNLALRPPWNASAFMYLIHPQWSFVFVLSNDHGFYLIMYIYNG